MARKRSILAFISSFLPTGFSAPLAGIAPLAVPLAGGLGGIAFLPALGSSFFDGKLF
jgi:hypothetical protein